MKKTRIFSAFLAAMLAVCGTAMPASAADDQPHKFGDVNGDGQITVSDAVLIARINAEDNTLNLSEFAQIAADANQDGTCNQKDLTDLLRYIAGLQTSLSGKYEEEAHTYAATNLTEGKTAALGVEARQVDGFRAAQLDFTANMLKEVAKQEGTAQNMLISPYSIAMALGMTANGAKGDTLDEMEKVLGGELHINDLNESYLNILQNSPKSGEGEKTYSDGYNEYREATLDIANSIWCHQDPQRIQVPEQFLQNTVDYYGASAYAAKDFGLPVVQDINHWVKKNTHGMIDKILPEQSMDDTVMVLVNALAFEGDWSTPYRDDQVSPYAFTLEDGTEFRTDMMYAEEHRYLEDDSAVGFKKMYAGGKYSFIGVLPDEDITISDYIAKLDGKKLESFLNSETSMYEVDTAMPKFTYDFGAKLNEPLENMGMPTAFDPEKADFTGLDASGTIEKTYISAVLHKTHIELDQKGTRAAAVTAVIMAKATAVAPNVRKSVKLDRPFVYMIYDEQAKLPVFIGTVMQPNESEK